MTGAVRRISAQLRHENCDRLVKIPNDMEKSCLNLIISSWLMEEKKEEEKQ